MSRAPGDIDPANLNVDPARNRRRKKRDRPEPHQSVKAAEAKTLAKLKRMPASPGVMLEPTEQGWCITSPHRDLDLWEKQIAEAFGSRSSSVSKVFMRQLRKLAGQSWDEDHQRWKADETELNAALAMVADVQPRNTQEAALAAQMVAIHWMQMRLSVQALNNGGMIMERDASLAGKLARTYAIQLDTLRSIRGGKPTVRQSIKVTKTLRQEVHYHTHPAGGSQEIERRVHERADDAANQVIDQRQAVRGEDESGVVVPLSRSPRAQ